MRGPGDILEDNNTLLSNPATRPGTITFICGCMFSGKTTDLLRRLAELPAGSSMVFKHVIDRRYSNDAVVSHDGETWPAVAVATAGEITPRLSSGIKTVAVEEAHFFDAHIVDVVRELASRGMSVIVTSLDRDSWGRPFPIAQQLGALADEPIVKRAVCARCDAVGSRTQRLTPIIDGDMVGGPESYESRCETCWRPPPEPPPAAG